MFKKDKYGYSGYAIGFDARSSFLMTNANGLSKNIFNVDNSSSLHFC